MSTNIKILLSESHDPWFNLATEDWLFQDLGDYDHVLFLWRNADTVVIGRSQNPWLECHLEKMQQDNVNLARRQSGGGAVFHDLGNANFTFISKKPNYRRRDNFDIIINALARFDIKAEVSGRNDIVVQTSDGTARKISGSAFKETPHKAFHHGTLLLDTDLMKLSNYLNPNRRKMIAKGVKSVKSRVINLKELYPALSFAGVVEALVSEFRKFHGKTEDDLPVEILQVESLTQNAGLTSFYQKMQDWDWLYGQTLYFTHRFQERLSWGTVDVQLEVDSGMIRDARVYSDSLYPDLIAAVQATLVGIKYHPVVISAELNQVGTAFPALNVEIKELEQWLLSAFA